MDFNERYVVFNNTGKNVSLEVFLPIEKDPSSLPFYKRRKYLNSKKVSLLIPRGTSLDLVESTGLGYQQLEENKDLQEKIRLLGPGFQIIERTIVYSFDEEQYLELEESIDPNFRYVEPDMEEDFEAFADSIPAAKSKLTKEEKIERLKREAEKILEPKKKKTKKKTTKKKAVKKTATKKTTKKSTSRKLSNKGNSKNVKEKEE